MCNIIASKSQNTSMHTKATRIQNLSTDVNVTTKEWALLLKTKKDKSMHADKITTSELNILFCI